MAFRFFLTVVFVGTVMGVPFAQQSLAQSSNRSDDAALNQLFTETVIRDNGRKIYDRALQMNPDQRYEFLRDWVLPNSAHKHFRFNGFFTKTNPVAVAKDSDVSGEPRLPSGGEIKSPALELIRTAKATDQLTQLANAIEKVGDTDNAIQRGKVCLLALVHLANKQPQQAKQQLEVLYRLLESSGKQPMDNRWPELIVSSIAVKVPSLRDVTRDLITSLDVYRGKDRTGEIATHFNSLLGGMKFGASVPLEHWHPASRVSTWTRGSGRPPARWHSRGGKVSVTSSHHTDYLFYQIPLLGDYEVECDLSNTPYQLGHISVAGRWLHLANDSKFTEGSFQQQRGEFKIEPKLASRKAWTKYRAVVRGKQISTYISGRLLSQRQIDVEQAPWVAILNNPNSLSSVRNVRITGKPSIPDTIYPLSEGYSAWHSYQNEQRSHWSIQPSDDGEPILAGQRVRKFPSRCQIESLLMYQRPVFEDGDIEYEFMYRAGRTDAHPALDRVAFLLEPDGIRLHHITDGKHDSGDDATDKTGPAKRVSKPLTLKENDWNRVQLSFRGNVLTISLNDDEILKHTIAPTNQRTLGLFHFCNQSDLLVRNIRWDGQWPKQLPDLDAQELAMPDHEALADLEDLTEQSTVLISRSTAGTEFSIGRGKTTQSYTPRGIQISAPMDSKGWNGWQMTGSKRYYGDMDVTLHFSGVAGTSGSGQSDFSVSLLDDLGNKYGTSRGYHQNKRVSACSKLAAVGPDGKFAYTGQHVTDESASGRLRILRRGDQVHSYIAHGDSDQFYHVFSRRLLQPDLPHSIKVEVHSMNGGQITATLERLIIRSQSEESLKGIDRQFTALTRFAKSFSDSTRCSFSSLDASRWVVNNAAAAKPSRSGLLFDLSKTPPGKELIMAYREPATGDFDVSTKFTQTLSKSESYGTPYHASLSLLLDADNDDNDPDQRLKASIDIHRKAADVYHVTATTTLPSGKSTVIGEYDAVSVETLRMVRIQRTIFFLCSGKENQKMLGLADLGTGDVVPGSVRFTVSQTKPSSDPARLILKSLQLSRPEKDLVRFR